MRSSQQGGNTSTRQSSETHYKNLSKHYLGTNQWRSGEHLRPPAKSSFGPQVGFYNGQVLGGSHRLGSSRILPPPAMRGYVTPLAPLMKSLNVNLFNGSEWTFRQDSDSGHKEYVSPLEPLMKSLNVNLFNGSEWTSRQDSDSGHKE
ncbi:hypothetical protein TNCV_2705301 [Trichonephila clavipes]|nr:hypothetical protein TNCV_2705301 [Trichonephila clavipes]